MIKLDHPSQLAIRRHQRVRERTYWQDVWYRAYNHTPARYRREYETKIEYDDEGREVARVKKLTGDWIGFGRYTTLARLLGLRLYSRAGAKAPNGAISRGGTRVGHLRVESMYIRGTRPRDDEVRRKLILLAGPYGHQLAMLKLKELGIAHRYKVPEEG